MLTLGLTPPLLFDGPSNAVPIVVLAHGAGAPMDSPFMTTIAEGLAVAGHRVARFEFLYMQTRRATGKRRPPDRAPLLIACWRAVIDALGGGENLVLGGKSMGGRIASMIADEVGARGLLCLGYPFHAPGKPPGARIEHLAGLATPTLVVQGTRDRLGRPEEIAAYALSPAIRIAWIDDGDYSLKPRKASGRSEARNLAQAIERIDGFLRAL